jgi:hypothetical protein
MYSGDAAWQDWSAAVGNLARTIKADLNQAKDLADKYYKLTYGLTDAQIQSTLPLIGTGKTTQDITNLRYALGVFTDLYNALNNVAALAQADRNGYLSPFV